MTTRFFQTFGLPLLGKELIEQAARKRTYVIRVVYAVVLSAISFLFFYGTVVAESASPLAVLGTGHDLYLTLVYVQFAGVYLFMPAMTCGVLTQEKERASLQLLFLTRLGPWAILFEKLLGRLIPMLGFLLLSLPLLAVAYSLGGISQELLWSGVWMLVLSAVQLGALALACSAFCRTSVGAFTTAYFITAIISFAPLALWLIAYLALKIVGVDLGAVIRSVYPNPSPGVFLVAMFPFFAPGYYLSVVAFPGGMGLGPLVVQSAGILCMSAVSLGLARLLIVRRAFPPPENVLLDVLKLLDWRRSGKKTGSPVMQSAVESDAALLPADDPIAWRETAKRALGRARYLFRLILLIEVPLVLFCGLLAIGDRDGYVTRGMATMLILLFWALAALIVGVSSASLIAGERSRQTLDILCTTPVPGREIVIQKFRGIRRLIVIFVAPILTLYIFEALLKAIPAGPGRWSAPSDFNASLYLISSALALGLYLPLVGWLSLAIGLKIRTQARAIMGSMAAIVAWCVAPILFIFMPVAILVRPQSNSMIGLISLLSPLTIIFMTELDRLKEFAVNPWLPVILNFLGYGIALVAVRALCLKNADRWLGRLEGESRLQSVEGGVRSMEVTELRSEGVAVELQFGDSAVVPTPFVKNQGVSPGPSLRRPLTPDP